MLGGNSTVLLDAVVAGTPACYVRGLDHGPHDVQDFVRDGLVYELPQLAPIDARAIARFYSRREWPAILRRYAAVDVSQDDVMRAVQCALSGTVCHHSERRMNIIAIIPARMGSSRFPGKPLAPLHGVPMLGHVYLRTSRNARLSGVYIATCDEEIRTYARSIGAPCVMTSSAHTRASDRTAEAVEIIERTSSRPIDAVVMVQGDEPMIVPAMIDEAIDPLLGDSGSAGRQSDGTDRPGRRGGSE